MSTPAPVLYAVTLRHLTNDGRKSDASLPMVTLHHVTESQLQQLLRAIERIAPLITYPAEPEARINGPTGNVVVRVKDGTLHMSSWSAAHRSGPTTAAEIIAAVSPEVTHAEPRAGRASMPTKNVRDKLTLVALGTAIVLVNCFTVWVLTRPPRSVAAKCRFMAPEPGQRLLASVAGTYETGKSNGDRRLEIRPDASAQRMKLGPGGVVKDLQSFTVQPAEAAGRPALLTSRKSVIMVKDTLSVVLYGDTYTRIN